MIKFNLRNSTEETMQSFIELTIRVLKDIEGLTNVEERISIEDNYVCLQKEGISESDLQQLFEIFVLEDYFVEDPEVVNTANGIVNQYADKNITYSEMELKLLKQGITVIDTNTLVYTDTNQLDIFGNPLIVTLDVADLS